MKGSSLNIMRNIRLRVKTGWLKESPPEYTFMKRYPPIPTTTQPDYRKVSIDKIPYMQLYDKVIERNPLYVDERLYPAYWEHQITPMAIAKRQYDLMKTGVPEEEAYYKALEYVEELESKAYDEMTDILRGVQELRALPFQTDEAVTAEINKWKEVLATRPYDALKAADQAEIDFLIQAKILKWNPVQRDFRMRDLGFAFAFEELRAAIFGDGAERDYTVEEEADDEEQETPQQLDSSAPFYYDDYVLFFEKLKSKPLVGRWSSSEIEKLNRWVQDTLIVKNASDRKPAAEFSRFIDEVRDSFFPMIRFPEKASSYVVPTVAEMRALLFANEIGYKSENGKLLIKRFYKIPNMLFPAETFAVSYADQINYVRHFEEDSFYLSVMLEIEGYPTSILPDVKARLVDIYRTSGRYRPGGFGGINSGANVENLGDTSIDAVLRGEFDDPAEKFLSLDDDGPAGGRRGGRRDTSSLGSKARDSLPYRQMEYLAALISNWRVVLQDLNNPEIMDALDALFHVYVFERGDYTDELLKQGERFRGHALEAAWGHVSTMIHDSDSNLQLIEIYLEEIFDAEELQDDEAKCKEMSKQAYRKVFLRRVADLLYRYYSLKDSSSSAGFTLSMEAPYAEVDIAAGEALFGVKREKVETPWDDRQLNFQRELEAKLGISILPVYTPPKKSEEQVRTRTESITRKYYRPPNTTLEEAREKILQSILRSEDRYTSDDLKDNTTWGGMRELAKEGKVDELKVASEKRLKYQSLIRGELAIEFERKEASRRKREFRRRGIDTNVHSYPLEMLDEA